MSNPLHVTRGVMESDLYGVLGVAPHALAGEIRRVYRRLALALHPDKNPGPEAAEKFHRVATAYEVLSDEASRKKYDEVRHHQQQKDAQSAKARDDIIAFRELLRQAEARADNQQQQVRQIQRQQLIEQLRAEGARLRRLMEAGPSKNYVSYRDLPLKRHGLLSGVSTVRVKWKHKAEALYDEALVAEIMAVFGPVKRVHDLVRDDRYDSALVEFERAADAQAAQRHDYSSAARWDGTRVRKLASLLRGCRRPDIWDFATAVGE